MQLISETHFSSTWAEPPRPGVNRPLAREILRATSDGFEGERWLEARVFRFGLGRPWQHVIEEDEPQRAVVFERFIGVTISDLCESARHHGHLLSLEDWWPLAREVLEAFETLDPQRLRWGDESAGVGWSLSGELMLSLTHLNSVHPPYEDLRVRRSDDRKFALLPPEAVRGLPLTRASVASVGLTLAMELLCGVSPFLRESALATLTAIHAREPRLPSSLHPEATALLDEAVSRSVAADQRRWASPRQIVDALAPSFPAGDRAKSVRALFALCEPRVRAQFALARRDAAWLPAEWDGVYARGATPADALAVLEDQRLEGRLPLEHFPRARP